MAATSSHPAASPLDADSPTPLYRQAMDAIRGWIQSGKLQRGDVLPAYRQLGPKLGVSEITVRRAVRELTREGLLVSRPGSGTFVANIRSAGASSTSVTDDLVVPGQENTPQNDALIHVGLVVGRSVEGSPYLARSVRGIRGEISTSTVLRFFEQPGGDWQDAARFAESVPLGELAGVLMYSPVNLELLVRCRRAEVPVVLLWNDVADGLTPCVQSDLASGVLAAVQHLTRAGRSRIALVTATEQRSSSARLATALHMSLAACGIETPGTVIACPSYSEADGARATDKLLSARAGQRPDAILYASDQQAVGGARVCRKRHRSVPTDVAIIGMGNVLAPDEGPIALTTIDLRAEEIGQYAIRKLQDLQAPGGRRPMRQVVSPRLVVRDSG